MAFKNATPNPNSKSLLKIRRARFEDMQTVAGFIRSSSDLYVDFVDEKDMAEHNVDESWITKNYFRREFYIGSDGDEDIGTISIQNIHGFAYLGYIYLDVNHVGKGFGHELMRFAKLVAKQRGMKGLILIAHPEASWAVRAYLKFGFKVVAKEKKDVLSWNGGSLRPYYEEGFHLFQLAL